MHQSHEKLVPLGKNCTKQNHHKKFQMKKGWGCKFVRHLWLLLVKIRVVFTVAQLMNHPPMCSLAQLAPNLHHLHCCYVKICKASHQLYIFSQRQDIVENAIVKSGKVVESLWLCRVHSAKLGAQLEKKYVPLPTSWEHSTDGAKVQREHWAHRGLAPKPGASVGHTTAIVPSFGANFGHTGVCVKFERECWNSTGHSA